jgi:DNA-binding transcriptional MerR regulator
MATQLVHARALEPTPTIPDRLYFKIGDVARILDLETYVLRFWETQFPQLKPNKSGTGQRLYRRRDVEMLLEIKRLVHAEGYTLAGARQALTQVVLLHREEAHRRPASRPDAQSRAQSGPQRDAQSHLPLMVNASSQRLDSVAAAIGQIRAELREIAGLLALPVSESPRRRTRIPTLPAPAESLFPL